MLRPRNISGLALILAVSCTRVSFAQNQVGSFTATPLIPDSLHDVAKADTRNGQPSPSAGTQLVSVIVKLDVDPVATYAGGTAGFSATSPEVTGAARLDPASPAVQRT